ncbi:MAG: hypothetical protein AAFW73_20835 [Bacteroidota bacterium]
MRESPVLNDQNITDDKPKTFQTVSDAEPRLVRSVRYYLDVLIFGVQSYRANYPVPQISNKLYSRFIARTERD